MTILEIIFAALALIGVLVQLMYPSIPKVVGWSFIAVLIICAIVLAIIKRKSIKTNENNEINLSQDIISWEKTKLWLKFIGFVLGILIVTIGVQVFIYRQTTYVEQTRPIISLDPIVKSVVYDSQTLTANITVEYSLINLRDKPSYQNQFRFASFRDIDPSTIEIVPDQVITNPIYKTANHQVTETFSLHMRTSPVEGQIINITYSKIRYADAPSERIHWYTETWWYALTMYFDASGQLVKVVNEEVDPSLIPKYEASINSKFPNELGENK
jgi:hypothetical protein